MIDRITNLFALTFGKQAGAGKTFHLFQTCPECGSKVCADVGSAEENCSCPNLDCPAQIRTRIEHWCSPVAMNIPGADAPLVANLVGQGLVRDVAELYRLKSAEVAALKGMDQVFSKSFFDAITASQKREAWRLLFGLSIPLVGAAEAKSLCHHFKAVDNVFAASVERLMQVEGMGETVSRSVMQWHSDSVNRKLVRRLFKAGLNFKA